METIIVEHDMKREITLLTSGLGCCSFCIMITFLIIFIAEIIFALSFKEGIDNARIDSAEDIYSDPNSFAHLADFISIMYGVEIGITLIFLIIFMVKKLYAKWYINGKQYYNCLMIFVLFVLWIIAAIVVTLVYEEENDTDLTFNKVLALIIFFTICGPCCIIFCW